MVLDTRAMTPHERDGLAMAWDALHRKLSRFIDVGDGVVQVRRTEIDAALAALRRDGHPVAHDVELWGLESLRVRFQRIGDQARALAERIGKGPVRVHTEHGGVHVDAETWSPFWAAFVHVVRNAIDHGFEDAAERAALGKGIATLTLRSYLRAGTLVIELADDGRGIAWDQLRDKARWRRGWPPRVRAIWSRRCSTTGSPRGTSRARRRGGASGSGHWPRRAGRWADRSRWTACRARARRCGSSCPRRWPGRGGIARRRASRSWHRHPPART